MIIPLLALAAAAAAPVDHPRTYLASIVGLNLGPQEYVDGFAIETWGVTYKAVCHIPPGWRLTAGSSASPNGDIKGEASHGVTFLDRKALPQQLQGLVLLTLYDRVQRADIGDPDHGSGEPATFKGSATVGTYGGDGPARTIRIAFANVRLTPAKRCPAIRP